MLEDGPLAYTSRVPSRNILKQYAADHYYHVYSRGVAKQVIFLDEQDYLFFISLFKRYLSNEPSASPARVPYPWYGQRIDLLAYCLMPNHIHLLFYQRDEKAITELMRSMMTSYSMYFNRRYKRVGPVFQSRYLASLIDQDSYLQHISRYIHLNPKEWQSYGYSSLGYYLKSRTAEWIKPQPMLDLFENNSGQYLSFLKDYESHKQMLEEIKWELAHE